MPAAATERTRTRPRPRRVLLVGRPNVGKSVLFHALTGRYATVSNYSGTTLDLRSAPAEGGLEVVDTPGMLSLAARTDDEAVTRDELLSGGDALIVHVANARDLHGAVTLTLDLARLGAPMVLVLNLADEARARGLHADAEALSALLGVPVVPTVAVSGEGLSRLRAEIARGGAVPRLPPLPLELGRACGEVEGLLPAASRRWGCLAVTGDDALRSRISELGLVPPDAAQAVDRLRLRFSRKPGFLYLAAARSAAAEYAARACRRSDPAGSGAVAGRWLDAFGRWSLRPWSGGLVALAVLWGLYKFVGVFGAQTAVEFLEDGVFNARLNPFLVGLAERFLPWAWLRDVLVGPYGAFTMAVTYALSIVLPIVTTFFIAFSLLEDSGYLPRFSVVTDRLFRLMGLNGKAVLPMMLGLGCGTMAIVTARILETRRERLLVAFLLSLTVPCSAQLGVVLGMAGASAPAVLATWLLVVGGTLVGVGYAASLVMPGAAAPFVVDIPPMRLPRPGNVLRKVASRLKWYLLEVLPLFVYGTLALFLLDRLGALSGIERVLSPLVQGLLGLPREATSAFLLGFLRRDYGAAGLYQLHREGLLEPRQVAVSLVCITLFMPCLAQWLMTLREQGSKACAAITGFVLAYALGVSALVNRLWLASGG